MTETMTPGQLCADLLLRVRSQRTACFSGLGVVFYRNLTALPHVALGVQSTPHPPLPVYGSTAISEVLAGIADLNSPWHDGFHLVDARIAALTHLSQFLSPDLQYAGDIPSARPFGARQMAALLASRANGIVEVGLITPSGEASYFIDGIQHLMSFE